MSNQSRPWAGSSCRIRCIEAERADALFLEPDFQGVIIGTHEDRCYRIEVICLAAFRLFIDDCEILPGPMGVYLCTPMFYAGRVQAVVVEGIGEESVFFIEVGSRSDKLTLPEFDLMLDEIRAFDVKLLAGTSAATAKFGREGETGLWSAFIQMTRLRQHGPAFLEGVRKIARAPHRLLQPASKSLPLSRVRRIHHSNLRDSRLLKMVLKVTGADEAIDSLPVRSSTPLESVDTPANRAMVALGRRFVAKLKALRAAVARGDLDTAEEGQDARRTRRLEILARLSDAATLILRAEPFRYVTRAETTAAGLTQIAAHPLYSRAYRAGMLALRLSIEGPETDDYLALAPSWSVYETWTFMKLRELLSAVTGIELVASKASIAPADLAFAGDLANNGRVELLFQAVFPSLTSTYASGSVAVSISRERRPDIVLAHRVGSTWRYLILDAKYRSGRSNVLDAMASAHIYQDSLRLEGRRPIASLLLLPGVADVPQLDTYKFWDQERVGTVSRFAPEGKGPERLADYMKD